MAPGEVTRLQVPLICQGAVGTAVFTSLRLSWAPTDPASAAPRLDIAWAQVTKHLVSPATKLPVRMRIDLASHGPPILFEFIDGERSAREVQQEVRTLVTELLHGNSSSAPAPAAASAAAASSSSKGAAAAAANGNGKGKAPAGPVGTTQWGRGRKGVLASASGGEALQATPDATNVLGGTAKHRAALLAGDSGLRQQYAEMVMGGLITAEEFWESRRGMLFEEQAKSKGQTPGAPSALQSDIEPQTKDNKLRYRLTPQAIHQIFVMYPAVEQAYHATVPHDMTEIQFWVKYFQSQYLHGNRGGSGGGSGGGGSAAPAGVDDMFARYAALEEEASAAADANGEAAGGGGGDGVGLKRRSSSQLPARHKVDPMVDLTEQFGDYHMRDMDRRSAEEASWEPAAVKVIKRFNRHAALVMDPPAKHGSSSRGGGGSGGVPRVLDTAREATELPELVERPPPRLVPLALRDASRYREGQDGAAAATAAAAAAALKEEEQGGIISAAARRERMAAAAGPVRFVPLEAATAALGRDFLLVMQDPPDLFRGLAAGPAGAEALQQLGSSSAREARLAIDPSAYSPGFLNEVNRQLQIMAELLRHFYGALSSPSPPPGKLDRLYARMNQQYDQLETMRKSQAPDKDGIRRRALLQPLLNCLNHAFEQWGPQQQHQLNQGIPAAAAAVPAAGAYVGYVNGGGAAGFATGKRDHAGMLVGRG